MILKDEEKIKVKMMDYAYSDFEDEYFDLIYAQGSISVPDKKEILKELKRILNINGVVCSGEIVSLREPVPEFVKDIWERSGLEPLASSEIRKYFEDKGFKLSSEEDLSSTLGEFYEKIKYLVSKTKKDEQEQDKKLYSRMKHESNAYLKLGGDKYIGFKSLIMRKAN
jgi:ubiquinone/menaquinone biosynthesis C-methylase UbiE